MKLITDFLNKVHRGNNLDILKEMPDESVDCIVSDPPYFLINNSGGGFMGKEWDSINSKKTLDIICKSKGYVKNVVEFFLLMKVESNMEEDNVVPENVNTIPEKGIITESKSSVLFVEENLKETNHKSKVNISSVPVIVLTRVEVLDMLKELSPININAIENLPESVLFVVPILYIQNLLKNIVPENVLKFPIVEICVVKNVSFTSTVEARIKNVIGVMIGKKLEEESMNVTIGSVDCVENIVIKKKYNVITLNHIEKQKIIQWITLLLFVSDATIKQKEDLNYSLIRQFHRNWLEESYRVLKSGAFAFIMSSPRQDVLSEMLISIHQAGFDTSFTSIYYTYASGFPKAMNIGKAIDKRFGFQREIVGTKHDLLGHGLKKQGSVYHSDNNRPYLDNPNSEAHLVSLPESQEAKNLDGSYAGFQPKPAVEIVIVAMKPLSEKSFVDQALKNGKGITWLEDCRIPFQSKSDYNEVVNNFKGGLERASLEEKESWRLHEGGWRLGEGIEIPDESKGRFPANLLIEDNILNDGTKHISCKSSTLHDEYGDAFKFGGGLSSPNNQYNDSGSYSRYFSLDAWWDKQIKNLPKEVQSVFPFLIVPKASQSERNDGLENFESKQNLHSTYGIHSDEGLLNNGRHPENRSRLVKNNHPACKPLKLFSYLITLGSRPNDIVLDPFCGSGTLGVACHLLNRNFICIDIESDYVEISKARISYIQSNRPHVQPVARTEVL